MPRLSEIDYRYSAVGAEGDSTFNKLAAYTDAKALPGLDGFKLGATQYVIEEDTYYTPTSLLDDRLSLRVRFRKQKSDAENFQHVQDNGESTIYTVIKFRNNHANGSNAAPADIYLGAPQDEGILNFSTPCGILTKKREVEERGADGTVASTLEKLGHSPDERDYARKMLLIQERIVREVWYNGDLVARLYLDSVHDKENPKNKFKIIELERLNGSSTDKIINLLTNWLENQEGIAPEPKSKEMIAEGLQGKQIRYINSLLRNVSHPPQSF